MAPYILTIGLNPVWQTTLEFPRLYMGETNRSRIYSSNCSGKGLNVTRVLHQAGMPVRHLTYGIPRMVSFINPQLSRNCP